MKARDRYPLEGVSCRLDGSTHPVVNLSLGGFFVATPRPLIVGQVVALDLVLGDASQVPIVGRVAWLNPPGKEKDQDLPPGFGVEITRISLPDKLRLVTTLREHSANEGPPPPKLNIQTRIPRD